MLARCILIALAVIFPLEGAPQPHTFEVASVKPVADPKLLPASHRRVQNDGVDFSNVTLEECLMSAWRLQDYQIIGPAWIRREHFTIVAKARGPVSRDEILLMLQTLLAERFRLMVHFEARPMNIFAIVVSKGGPKLTESRGTGPTYVGPADPENGATAFRWAPIQQLAWRLRQYVGRPVIDETGLAGLYDYQLPLPVMLRSGPQDLAATEPDYVPSVFTSVKEHLGLELKAKKAPVDVLVIDHVESPTPN